MRVRDHVVVTTAVAAVIAPLAGPGVLGLWVGGVLIDADHYLWYCVRQRRLSPVAAVRYFNDADSAHHGATRALHSPLSLAGVLLAAVYRPRLLLLAAGMAMHVVLDARHEARMGAARSAALERDDFVCRACGSRAHDVGTHIVRQPLMLPSYRSELVVSLCRRCHEQAHAGRMR